MADKLTADQSRRKVSPKGMIKELTVSQWEVQRFPWGGWVYIGPTGEKRYNELPGWGTPVLDVYLRALSRDTSIFSNVLSRQLRLLRSFDWEVRINPKAETAAAGELACHYYHRMLLWCSGRRGWLAELAKAFTDMRTLTRGGFLRFHRVNRYAPIHDIEALDALRCWPTGRDDTPVLYWPPNAKDPITLGWWESLHLTDMEMTDTTPTALVRGLGRSALYDLRLDALTELSLYRVLGQMSGRIGMERLALVYGISVDELKAALTYAKEEREGDGSEEMPLVPGMAWVAAPEVGTPGGKAEKPSLDIVDLAKWPDGVTWIKFQQHYAAVCEARMGEAVGTSYPLEQGTRATTAARISEARQTGTGATTLLQEVVDAFNMVVMEGPNKPSLVLDELWSEEDEAEAVIQSTKAGTVAIIINTENAARWGPTATGEGMPDKERRVLWQHYGLHVPGMFADDEIPDEPFAIRSDDPVDFEEDIAMFSETCEAENKGLAVVAERAITFPFSMMASRRFRNVQAIKQALAVIQIGADALAAPLLNDEEGVSDTTGGEAEECDEEATR